MEDINLIAIFKNNKLCSECENIKNINCFTKLKKRCNDCCNNQENKELLRERRKEVNKKYYLKKSIESPKTYYTPKKRTQEILTQ
tara:strand:- start:3667 stop:3921 length:255 start_codon:yes stop_codon:yes gene_type:complete